MSSWLPILPSALSAITALAALAVAVVVYRGQRGWHTTDTLLQVVQRFEAASARQTREEVYLLKAERLEFASWAPGATAAIDAWCADLDVAALLLLAGQVNMTAFLALYGDVVLRSVYIIAPYAVDQRKQRGDQFLLPLGQLAMALVRAWQTDAAQRRYPDRIAFKYGGGELTPTLLLSDHSVQALITKWER